MTSVPTSHNEQIFFPDSPLVRADWLAERLATDDSLVVLCASMGDPVPAKEQGIPGAVLADIDDDFSDATASLPHTVPGNLIGLLQNYGISDDCTVVVYDRHGLMVSPRVWWLLRIAGLKNIGVLDGGLPEWIRQGYETASLSNPSGGGHISSTVNPDLLVGSDGVERALARSKKAVVDARSAGRFSGVEEEPRPGLRKGNIPGSVNIPFNQVVDESGLMRPAAELREVFESTTDGATSLVMSCGSGVTACVDALAAVVAGYEDVVVYDGSWADWGNPENQKPIG